MKGSGGLEQLLVWMSYEKDIKQKTAGKQKNLKADVKHTL